jgi:hypothetical protein
MSSFKYLLLFLLCALSISSPLLATEYSDQHKKLVQIFQSNEEPAAKDAVWTSEWTFKVGLINDGSNRRGYAQYVCAVLDDYGFKGKGVWVQIIDIVKLKQSDQWVKLGETHCK